MRTISAFLISTLLVSGCVSDDLRERYQSTATSVGISNTEIVALARVASERHQLFVIDIRASDDATIVITLCRRKHPPYPAWKEVTLRRIGGHWQEDPKAERDLIV
jgi:hypothetical protein